MSKRLPEREIDPIGTDNGHGRVERQSLGRLIAAYLLILMVTLVVVAVATAYVSRRLGVDEAIADAERLTTLIAGTAIEPALEDGLLIMDPDAIARLDRVVRADVLGGSVARVKLWSPDGVIIYSDESRLIGEQFDLDDEENRILWTGGSEAELSDLSKPENRFEEPATELLEVYLAVETPSGQRLLYESYYRYAGVTEAGRQVWLRFAPISLGALLLLAALQVPIVLTQARRLQRSQDQREDLLRQAIESADVERRRIASDLHDGVVQDLVGVGFALAATARRPESSPVHTQVSEAADQLRDAVRSLRSLLVEIYPANLREEGLEAALSDLLARVEPRGVDTTLVVEPSVGDIGLERAQLLYRAAQEGVRNVLSHSDASHVELTVTRINGSIVLRVIDDGKGFDVQKDPDDGHIGLRSLAGLAASGGARVVIESAPGSGTELRMEVPVT